MDKRKTKDVVAIAIKPVFAHAILSGEKTVEFRKNGAPTNIKSIVFSNFICFYIASSIYGKTIAQKFLISLPPKFIEHIMIILFIIFHTTE